VQTLLCGNTAGDCLLQATGGAVRLVSASMRTLVAEWAPPAGQRITVAAGNAHQVVVATGRNTLVVLSVADGRVAELGRTTTSEEIACLSVHPLGAGRAREPSTLVAVGLWDKSIRLLRLPALSELVCERIGGDVIPRSLLLTTLEGVDYLLCALGDGCAARPCWAAWCSAELRGRKVCC